jgi:hypothetical protein
LEVGVGKVAGELGDVVDAGGDLGLGSAALAPDLGQGRGNAAKVDVEDNALVGKVVVNVAVAVLEEDRGHSPGVRVGRLGGNVGGHVSPLPGEELDVVAGPLHGVDATVLGGPRTLGLGRDAALVVVLVRGVLVAVVTVARQDARPLADAVQNALAVLWRVVGVNGGLVPGGVVPLLVDVNLAIVGPVLAIGPPVKHLHVRHRSVL